MSEANKNTIMSEILSIQKDMVHFATSLCRDYHMGEDLAQEALIRVYGYKKLDQITNVKAWVFRIIRNVYVDRVRVAARRPRTQTIEDTRTGSGTNESVVSYVVNQEINAHERHGSGSDNHDMLFSDHIAKALKELPDSYEQAVILSDVEDHTYEEIAQKLNIPVGTVRSRIFRGRKLLRERITDLQAA